MELQRISPAAMFDAYSRHASLRTIVNAIADRFVDMNLRAYRPTLKARPSLEMFTRATPEERRKALDSGEFEEVPDHPAFAVLGDPSPHMTGRALVRHSQIHIELVGETFWVLNRVGPAIVGVWPMAADRLVSLPNLAHDPKDQVYEFASANGPVVIPAANVLHFKDPNPLDVLGHGTGLGATLGDELDTLEGATQFLKSFFFKHTIPAAVIAIEGLTQESQQRSFLERLLQWRDRGAGGVLVTSGNVTVARLDAPLKDSQILNIRRALTKFIRTTFGVPPDIIGDTSESNMAATRMAPKLFAEQVLKPRMEFWRTELQNKFFPLFGAAPVVLEYDPPDNSDRDESFEIMKRFRTAYTVNEVRALTGHPPDPKREGEFNAPAPGSVEGMKR
jgi:HK97 family phage portal protein